MGPGLPGDTTDVDLNPATAPSRGLDTPREQISTTPQTFPSSPDGSSGSVGPNSFSGSIADQPLPAYVASPAMPIPSADQPLESLCYSFRPASFMPGSPLEAYKDRRLHARSVYKG